MIEPIIFRNNGNNTYHLVTIYEIPLQELSVNLSITRNANNFPLTTVSCS